jgi:GT2 family glycosyltransferase
MQFCLHDLLTGAHDFSKFQAVNESLIVTSQAKAETESGQEQIICLIADCEVTFFPSYFAEVMDVFGNKDVAVVYSDFEFKSEFKLGDSHIRPPSWSPERFLSNDFMGPVIALDFAKFSSASGSFTRTSLMLECLARNLEVKLLETVGYAVSTSNLNLQSPSRKSEIQAYLENNRLGSEVSKDSTPWLEISNKRLAPDLISVVIPTRGAKKSRRSNELIVDCVTSLTQQSLGTSKVEIVVVYDTDCKTDYLEKLKKLETDSVSIKLVPYDPPFNFSAKCNLGASTASGEVILFLNDDTVWRTSDSLLELAGSAMIENVGAVGAKLFFENGRLQHGGYILTRGFIGHAYFRDVDGFGPFGDLAITHEVVGVTGACLAQRKEVWESLGGWDILFPGAYNDIDYCFRIRERGLSILQVNAARLYHYESITRNPTVKPEETKMINAKWGRAFGSEPYFRQAVTQPEVTYLRGTVIQDYSRYIQTTYRHHGFKGVVKIFSNGLKKVRKRVFN